jgi:hypothetical protein
MAAPEDPVRAGDGRRRQIGPLATDDAVLRADFLDDLFDKFGRSGARRA